MRLVSYVPNFPRARSVFDADPAFRMLDTLFADRATPASDYGYEALDENTHRLTLTVAGLGESDLAVEAKGDLLSIEGESEDGRYKVSRRFRLGEFMEVVGAKLDKGLLTVDIERVIPEALKPRRIEIESSAPKTIARKAKKLIGGEKKAA